LKFLVIQWLKPDLSLEMQAKLIPAQIKYLDDRVSKGKVEKLYHLIGQQGTVMVCDVESEEDLSRLISKDPLFFHSRRRIYPLITPEAHKQLIREALAGQ